MSLVLQIHFFSSPFVFFVIIASTAKEVDERKKDKIFSIGTSSAATAATAAKNSQAPVAVLRRHSITSDQKGTLACALPWGFGYGWNINNGIWGGGKPNVLNNIKITQKKLFFSIPYFFVFFVCPTKKKIQLNIII